MKVFLHLSAAGLYYAGREFWVRDRQHALDLKTIKHATAIGHAEGLDSMVIVMSSGDPSSDWFVPLRREQAVPLQAAPVGAQARLPRAA
jgi:hypothetical protein